MPKTIKKVSFLQYRTENNNANISINNINKLKKKTGELLKERIIEGFRTQNKYKCTGTMKYCINNCNKKIFCSSILSLQTKKFREISLQTTRYCF